MAIKEQLEQAGYDTSGMDEAALLSKLDEAGYDVSSLQTAPAPSPVGKAFVDASNPYEMLSVASPSNLGKLAGVVSVNSPGMTETLVNSLPGMGNPSRMVPAAMNAINDLKSFGDTISRVVAVQGGAKLTPQETVPARVGQAAGMVLESMVPGKAVKEVGGQAINAVKNNPVVAALRNTGANESMALGEKLAELPLAQTAERVAKEGLKKEAGSAIGKAEKALGIDQATGSASLRRAAVKTAEAATKFADRGAKLSEKGAKRLAEIASPESLQFYRKTAGDALKMHGRSLTNEARNKLMQTQKTFADAIGLTKEGAEAGFSEAVNKFAEMDKVIKALPAKFTKEKQLLNLALVKAKNLAKKQAPIRKAAGWTGVGLGTTAVGGAITKMLGK